MARWLNFYIILVLICISTCTQNKTDHITQKDPFEIWRSKNLGDRGKVAYKVSQEILKRKPSKDEMLQLLGDPDFNEGECFLYKYTAYYNSMYNDWPETLSVCYNQNGQLQKVFRMD